MNFDDIRCYYDEEIPAAFERLIEEKQFMKVVSTIYPLLPKELIKQRLTSFRSALDFQKGMVYPFLQQLDVNQSKGIALYGVENIDKAKSYLYISNHRDIILDSAFLCYKLIDNGMDTVEIAIGDNLLVFPWIEELVRINKSFIVKRGLSARQVLESSQKMSAYILHTIDVKSQSIWLAQREGRAKNSDDRTQESLLKMLNMSGKGTVADNLAALNICPLSISYEFDPCDYLKAKEFQQKRDNADYKKSQMDDLINMQTGVMGYKGRVEYKMNGCVNTEIVKLGEQISNKAELYTAIAQLIDSKIHGGYTIYNVNKIAYDLLEETDTFSKEYSLMEKLDFEKYLEKQLGKIDLENRDDDFLLRKMLEMYANPLKNYLKNQ
ncbi:MAG: 1-acyl-sn-glycerol-3-phosphate acyltransferase [Paludibacter sp.]